MSQLNLEDYKAKFGSVNAIQQGPDYATKLLSLKGVEFSSSKAQPEPPSQVWGHGRRADDYRQSDQVNLINLWDQLTKGARAGASTGINSAVARAA